MGETSEKDVIRSMVVVKDGLRVKNQGNKDNCYSDNDSKLKKALMVDEKVYAAPI